MIKKFKNGNIHMKADKDITLDEFINGEMFWNDLYIVGVDNPHIVDYNTSRVYAIPYLYICRDLTYFIDDLRKGLKLYPSNITIEEVEGYAEND